MTGQVDDGGMPLYRSESALYSLAGECLADFDEVLYEGAMGRYVIRRDYADEFDSMAELPEDYTTALIDGLTQQVVLQDVLQLKALDEHRLIALDPRRCLLGVVDDQAQILAGFRQNRITMSRNAATAISLPRPTICAKTVRHGRMWCLTRS